MQGKGQMETDLGKIIIDNDVIATFAGAVAVECFGIVGMAAVNVKDGLVKLLKKDYLSHGINVTVSDDNRITRVGAKLRNLRLDELPQVFDVLSGDMSFVGTRPEVVKYVKAYKPEFYATLLMPAGITSEASIKYKREYELLSAADDVDKVYINDVLPDKMKWNLNSVKNFSFFGEIMTMVKTVFAVLEKD